MRVDMYGVHVWGIIVRIRRIKLIVHVETGKKGENPEKRQGLEPCT